MNDPYIFGYGSLVNRATHDYPGAGRARLRGWRRVWRYTSLRQVAFLNVEPAERHEISGLVFPTPVDRAALDAREYAYAPVRVSEEVAHDLAQPAEVFVYAIAGSPPRAPDETHALLLSYIDTVVAGFLAEFGEDGVAEFFVTTMGWEAPVWDDRECPVYSRHTRPADDVLRMTDEALARLPCRITALPADFTPSGANAKAASGGHGG